MIDAFDGDAFGPADANAFGWRKHVRVTERRSEDERWRSRFRRYAASSRPASPPSATIPQHARLYLPLQRDGPGLRVLRGRALDVRGLDGRRVQGRLRQHNDQGQLQLPAVVEWGASRRTVILVLLIGFGTMVRPTRVRWLAGYRRGQAWGIDVEDVAWEAGSAVAKGAANRQSGCRVSAVPGVCHFPRFFEEIFPIGVRQPFRFTQLFGPAHTAGT